MSVRRRKYWGKLRPRFGGMAAVDGLLRLWCLRALRVACNSVDSGREVSQVLDAVKSLGIEVPEPPGGEEDDVLLMTSDRLTAELKTLARRRRLESHASAESARRLSSMLGLDAVETELLTLLAVEKFHRTVRSCMQLGMSAAAESRDRGVEFIAEVLGVEPRGINAALAPSGILRRAGLVSQEWENVHHSGVGLELDDALALVLSDGAADEAALLDTLAPIAPPPSLTETDFAHVADELSLLRDLLRRARTTGAKGVNVLLYGPPGTGKTELARLVAALLDAPLHAVPNEVERRSPHSGRIDGYAMAQRLLVHRAGAVILFDEIEDAFPFESLPFFGVRRRSTMDKAWVNDLLETNPVPAIWVSNQIDHLDPALLRRFTLRVKLDTLPRPVRERMVRRVADTLPVSDDARAEWATRVAAREAVTPADLARVQRVVELAGLDSTEAPLRRLEQITALSLGQLAAGAPKPPQADETYDTALARTSVKLDTVVEGLRRQGRGTVFMYGPPGTGKTAFAYHVARTLDRPIHHVRASDLLDPFVGVTERKMAEMFVKAREQGAVLLLDEADTFFSSREGASKQWEVSHTNELLMQTEAADCIFLCTTNLVDRIDTAAFRRFDVRVKFEVSDAFGLVRLVAGALRSLGSPAGDLPEADLARRLGALSDISAGDVKALRRQFELLGEVPTPEAFADALRADAALRGKKRTDGPRIGF
jgi:transitional endoplasmic reticulum ATPase